MADSLPPPRRSAEIYGYVDRQWSIIGTALDEPRDAILHRARTMLWRPEVMAIRVLMQDGGDVDDRPYIAWRADKIENVPEPHLTGHAIPRPPVSETSSPPPLPSLPSDPLPAAAAPGLAGPMLTVRAGLARLRGRLKAPALRVRLPAFRVRRPALRIVFPSSLLIRPNRAATETPEPLPLPTAGEAAARLRTLPPVEPIEIADLSAPAPEPEAVPRMEAAQAAPDVLRDVLKLVAANLDRLRAIGVSPSSIKVHLAIRLYVAGACDARCGPGPTASATAAQCLCLLGETPDGAERFAGTVLDFLASPLHRAFYLAGRSDAAAATGAGAAGHGFAKALVPWLSYKGGDPLNLALMAVGPLDPRHRPAVEALVGVYGGDMFGRENSTLIASFATPATAAEVARTIRDAVATSLGTSEAPGIGLAVGTAPRPDQTEAAPGASLAMALADAAGSGHIAVSPLMRALLAEQEAETGFTPLWNQRSEGYRIADEAHTAPAA